MMLRPERWAGSGQEVVGLPAVGRKSTPARLSAPEARAHRRRRSAFQRIRKFF